MANVQITPAGGGSGDMTKAAYDAANVNEQLVGLTANQILTNKTLTSPKINSIKDTNGNSSIDITATASAVNYVLIKNQVTGSGAEIWAKGSDTNVDLKLIPQGTGSVSITDSSGVTVFDGDGTSGDVNYISVRSSATGNNPFFKTTNGSDTNIGMNFLTKGTGKITFQDGTDITKKAAFDVSGLTTGHTTTLAVPEVNGTTTIVGTDTSQTLTNKTLDNTNAITIKDTNFTIQDDGSATKQMKFQLSGLTTTRTFTSPDADTTIVGTDATQILTNKTIDLASGSNTIKIGGTALSGTPSSSTFLRGDGLWATPAGGTTPLFKTVRACDAGGETYTIVAGSVTQIAGTVIDGVTLAIGDRLGIFCAPASSGVGSFVTNTAPNGIYVVTGNTTNLTVTRATDMSGTETPIGTNVLVREGNQSGGWMVGCSTPTSGAFTWGTTTSQWAFSWGTLNNMSGLTETLQNKTLDNTNAITIKDTNFTIQDDGSTSKQLQFQLSGLTTTRTWTAPDADLTIVGTTTTQTLTNKTITSPKINRILDTNGVQIIDLSAASSAANNIQVGNAASGGTPYISALGTSDSNVGLDVIPKGTGSIRIWENSGSTATLNAGGTATDIDLNLTTQGAGVVKANSVAVATISGAQTLTNKTITPRSTSTNIPGATPTWNTNSFDIWQFTGIAAAITSMSSSFTSTSPVVGQKMLVSFKDNGTARAITWGASFQSSGVASLLATTVINKTHWVTLMYDGSKWTCVAVDANGY